MEIGEYVEKLEWEDGKNVKLHHNMIFGKGYDFEGLELCSKSAKGSNGNYLMWPKGISNSNYSLYRDSDGLFAFEEFTTEESCKEKAEIWNKQIL